MYNRRRFFRPAGQPRSNTRFRSDAAPNDTNVKDGLSPQLLRVITIPEGIEEDVVIDDLGCIGSYNWTDSASPTIIVPGSPRIWTDRALPFSVRPDVGLAFRDQNTHRCPRSPLLPLFRAVDKYAEDFDWSSVDIITDRNNLRKLLKWIDGDKYTAFRIDLQLLSSRTVLLQRWEPHTQDEMPGKTYGFNFEKAATEAALGCEQGTGHHRIVTYTMNGLNLVVRFEVDGCIRGQNTPSSKHASSSDVDDLLSRLSGVHLNASSKQIGKDAAASKESPFPTITILEGGAPVPQSHLLELTTRATHRETDFDWKRQYPQLFLSQTPYHFLGVHERGTFVRVTKRKIAADDLRSAIDESLRTDFRTLRRVLDIIKSMVIEHGKDRHLSLVLEQGDDRLKVYERTSPASFLPDDVLERFTTV